LISLNETSMKCMEGESMSSFFLEEEFVPPQDDGLNETQQDGPKKGFKDNLRRGFMIGRLPPKRWTCHHNFFLKTQNVEEV